MHVEHVKLTLVSNRAIFKKRWLLMYFKVLFEKFYFVIPLNPPLKKGGLISASKFPLF